MSATFLKLLFIVNPGSGKNSIDWKKEILEYFQDRDEQVELFDLPNPCEPELITAKIKQAMPDRVIAVGGDGTLKLVAGALPSKDLTIGLLPAGSANGMAKELGIPAQPAAALEVIHNGVTRRIHLVKVNNEYCVHLSDIGFNAFVVKKFEDEGTRGMWGYVKAAWKTLLRHYRMQVEIRTNSELIRREAAMVVIANGKKYGTGVVINPEGDLADQLFEVVIVKKISFAEIFKMRFTHRPYDPAKTELLQTDSLRIASRHRVHFQVDGEYLGKVKEIRADIIPGALKVLVPEPETSEKKESI